ncbi:uncharacterized protein LOC133472775 [Phyllopteryx taeniolatus]|uniref:uncharacterized protein LOC133472775 n=1 Tax=Phyllopteryx taeniolatus TaxID=161469 RepID=UPI002AD27140|nr:uncharacterized protein LOC133472775 [Phyllopteryx taeniolatus]
MPLVTRLFFVFVLVCAAVTSLITRSHSARASPVRVLGADVMKTSSYSLYRQYVPSSSGRQSSQRQNPNNVFHSRQKSQDSKPFQPEERRQGENLDKYQVVILKSAPSHPFRQSSTNAEEGSRFEDLSRVDAPKMPASTRDQSGVKTVRQSSSVLSAQPGRYLSGRRVDTDTHNEIRPGRFPLRRPTALKEKNLDASVIKHTPQLEKLTSPLANGKKVQSFLFKPSFVKPEHFGKSMNSPAILRDERKVSTEEDDNAVDVAQNAARYRATSRLYWPRHFAAQSHKDAFSAHVLPPVAASRLVARTTRKPVPLTSSKAFGKSLGIQNSRRPASIAFANNSPPNKGKDYAFKMANVYPFLSSKYSFSRRQVGPRTTAALSTSGFRPPKKLDRRLLKQPSNHRVEGANAATRPSNKSAVQQIFESLERNISQVANTSAIPKTSLLHRNASGGKEAPTFAVGQNEPQTETPRGATAGHVGSEGLAEGRSRLFSTSTSSTVRGRRVHAAHHAGPKRVAGNSPIIRLPKRPKGEPRANASTTRTPTTAAAVSDVTELGVRFSSTEVPVATRETSSRGATLGMENENEKSSGSEVSDSGLNEAPQEDLLDLHYLRISMGNVSFKSI